jgi:hypothetical protein
VRLDRRRCSRLPRRRKTVRPKARAAFEAWFPDEAALGRHLVERRWPDGFVCPHRRGREGWRVRPTF